MELTAVGNHGLPVIQGVASAWAGSQLEAKPMLITTRWLGSNRETVPKSTKK